MKTNYRFLTKIKKNELVEVRIDNDKNIILSFYFKKRNEKNLKVLFRKKVNFNGLAYITSCLMRNFDSFKRKVYANMGLYVRYGKFRDEFEPKVEQDSEIILIKD